MRTRAHTDTHTRTHARTHTHAHTHTHTHSHVALQPTSELGGYAFRFVVVVVCLFVGGGGGAAKVHKVKENCKAFSQCLSRGGNDHV